MSSKKQKKVKNQKDFVENYNSEDFNKDLKHIDNEDILLERTLQGLKEESEINPDLELFFNKVKEKKSEYSNKELEETRNIEQPIETKSRISKTDKKDKSFGSKFRTFMLLTSFIASLAYFTLRIKDTLNNVNYVRDIINSCGILLAFLFIIISIIGNKKIRNIFSILSSTIIIGIISLNLLLSKDIIKLPTLKVLDDFTNTSASEVMKWAKENEIEIETIYEYSDNIEEGKIIFQDKKSGNILKSINKLVITVSSGPNYDKELVLSNWTGKNVDDLIKYIKTNHLKNASLDYVINNDIDKNIVISQSVRGEIKRNSNISFTISLGSTLENKEIKLENLTKKSLFDATLYLKSNGLKYKVTYEFSKSIKSGYVISHDPKSGSKVSTEKDAINLVISKGKEIIVPNFTKADVDTVINWIIENNLKVVFEEKYDSVIEKDKFISINLKTGDSITEGSKVVVTTSKGPLIVQSFKNINEFRSWANDNGVKFTEKYEYSNTINKGDIISLSIKSGDKIDPVKEQIVVTISYGQPVTVPNFYGMAKSAIQSTCNSRGLNCTFSYSGYDNRQRDTAISQNVASGSKVVKGTYVNIRLSSGPAKTFKVYINSELFGSSYNSTVNSIRKHFNENAPGVIINFVPKSSNSCIPGVIHTESPRKGGIWYDYTQGMSYTIWIMDC